jgi:YidC/Oxa1 family membrane protein insertase
MIWDSFILNPMLNALIFIYDFLGNNFGIAIVVFTALVRLITLPLTWQSQRSTQRMQELQQSKRWRRYRRSTRPTSRSSSRK